MAKLSTKVVTGKVRLSYANLFEPKALSDGAKAKFSVSLIISKDDTQTIEAINAAIDNAIIEGTSSKFGGKKPNRASIKTPLRDGDLERDDDPAYKNAFFLNANSYTAPQIVDTDLNAILDKSEVYSGCYARVSISFYAYNSNGNKGIACGLGNVQKLEDGEPLSGKTNATSDFSKKPDEFM